MTSFLLGWFGDVVATWAPVAVADLVCVGSVLEHVPAGWSGVVAGAGKLRTAGVVDLSSATVVGVRGPLTARLVTGMPAEYALGDPALLANELVEVTKDYELGLVPHWSDDVLETREEFRRFDPVVIRPDGDPLAVLAQIGRCKKIVASSLHGIIVADSFGIPRRTEMCPRVLAEGGDFKFRDHGKAIGVDFVVGKTQFAPRHKVERRQHELYDMFADLGRRLS